MTAQREQTTEMEQDIVKSTHILIVLLLFALIHSGMAFADPVLNQGRTVGDKIVIFPDHRNPKVLYYVPAELNLSQSYGKPQFFFYKYVYIKQDGTAGSRRTAGGVLSLSLELSDEKAILERVIGKGIEFKVVPIERMKCVLNYSPVGDAGTAGEGAKESNEGTEKLAERETPFTKKSFTLPLNRETASYLWTIFEEKKSLGLSVDCELTFCGFEVDEGKYVEAMRTDRISFPVTASMEQYPDLFKVIDLANKVSFNYRTLTVLCFDFLNDTDPDALKKSVEVKIETAKSQKDFRTVSFSKNTDPQQELSFNIPEKKGATYQYRVTTVLKNGMARKGEWNTGSDSYLDISEYEILAGD
ncbi:MAG: hypothetical protein AB1756_08210 [Acidobacteriota bacterium]